MRKIACIVLTIVCAFVFRAQAQTPYDSFAPESTRPMLGLDALHAMKQEFELGGRLTQYYREETQKKIQDFLQTALQFIKTIFSNEKE